MSRKFRTRGKQKHDIFPLVVEWGGGHSLLRCLPLYVQYCVVHAAYLTLLSLCKNDLIVANRMTHNIQRSLLVFYLFHRTNSECQFVKRPWAPQPLVCIGCTSGWIAADGKSVTSSNRTAGIDATYQTCLPCKINVQGCVLCTTVAPGHARPYDCTDSSTSSTIHDIYHTAPNASSYLRKKPIVVEVGNDGIHPGSIKFDKFVYDSKLEWKRATVCKSMEFAQVDLINSGNYFECVCDSTCDDGGDGIESHAGQSLGRCVGDACRICPDGWKSRGDYTMFTNCVVYEPIQTACWVCVIVTSLMILVVSFKRSYELYRLRHLWRTYYATMSAEALSAMGEDDEVPVLEAVSMHCQDLFYLVWKHDDGFFLLLAIVRSFLFLFFVAVPKVYIGNGAEIGKSKAKEQHANGAL